MLEYRRGPTGSPSATGGVGIRDGTAVAAMLEEPGEPDALEFEASCLPEHAARTAAKAKTIKLVTTVGRRCMFTLMLLSHEVSVEAANVAVIEG